MATLEAVIFKDSQGSFLEALEENEIKFNRRIQLSEVPLASGIDIQIIVTGGWAVITAVILAWAHVRSSRRINVTTKNKTSVWLEGYSAEEAAKVLEAAEKIAVIDTKQPDET